MNPSSTHQSRTWEEDAVDKVVADCLLNQRLVEIGLWPKFLIDMTEEEDLSYSLFLLRHRRSLSYLLEEKYV